MSYRVFARKYRPQTFEEVVGQEHITRTLQNAISSGRVAQAYLFVGPRGIGKTSTARILAKALNCQEGTSAEPCGKCSACLEIAEGRSLDVLEIDGASNNGVENIRELRENAAYAPARGPYKIYLIDEVHMLSAGAFNALLKTLEEPPAHVKFIFATTEAQKVPATITSRCQRFDLRRIPTASIATHLQDIAKKENIEFEPAAAEAIARAAEGGLRDAESMLDQAVAFCGEKITAEDVMTVFGFTSRETITSLMEKILARDASSGLQTIAAQNEAGKDLSRLLADLVAYLRDMLVAGVDAGQKGAPREKLLMLLDHFAETEGRMRWASDKKLQFDVAIIKAIHLLEQASLDDVIETLSALHSGGPMPIPPVAAPVTPAVQAAPAPRAAEKPAAIPSPAPKPVRPAPAPTPAVSAAPEEKSIDASLAWDRVAKSFESSLVYRWLAKGIFAEATSNGFVTVHLPASCKAEFESLIGEKGRRDAETRLAEALNRKVKVILEISDKLEEPVIEEAAPELQPAPAEPEPAATLPPAASKDPMEDFKNDPLIKKALEIFAGEIQTLSK